MEKQLEQEKVVKTKQSFFKKKIIGIPVILFMIMGIGLVLAVGIVYVYVYESSSISFVKTLNPRQIITEYISMEYDGDIDDSIIDCDSLNGATCQSITENITLTNSDDVSHTCSITYPEVFGSFYNATLYNSETNTAITSQIIVPADSSYSFYILYNGRDIVGEGDEQSTGNTTITCPNNM